MEPLSFAPLSAARLELKTEDGASTPVEDTALLRALREVSARIEADPLITRQPFAPRVGTRYFNARSLSDGGDLSGAELWLDTPVLSVSAVVNGDGVAYAGSDYTLFPRDGAPYTTIRLKPTATVWRAAASGETEGVIEVTGTWGYRRGNGWVGSGDSVQNNPLTSSGTALTVSDADGADANGRAPRFSPGQLLQIDSEFVIVLAVELNTNVLTILRGARGSTAAAHAQGATIALWQPEPNIERATARWAAYLLKRRGNFETVRFDGVTTTAMPQDMPEEIKGLLAPYMGRPGRIRGV